jgi:putative hydrolase of the HAD superfamily
MSRIKAVFFDLGSTLIHAKIPWEGADFWRRGDVALMQVLQDAGFPLAGETFVEEYGTFLDRYYTEREPDDTTERTAFSALLEMLVHKGYPNVPGHVLRTALEALYAVTDQNWIVEEDAIPTLETLKRSGYHLGIISNTSDDAHVQRLLDKNGFCPFFETVITSAELGIRKPDPRIFQVALEHFRVQPEAAAMVGDMLDADVLGANQSGIYSIWITRRVQLPEEGELAIQPQAVVTALHQIPALLAEIEKDYSENLT